ncbi:PAS domain S-box protein, partial [Methanoregula sp.]|uniref:PAS domain S-box protein n=1 Tax=Methanoregula sp. TaxID=2052170 RepID=UPI000CB850F8
MKSTDDLHCLIGPVIASLPPEQREAVERAVARIDRDLARAETKYQRAIRERGAVHALLKKTSGDLLARYRTIFEYAGTAMAVIEQGGTISLVNSVFAEMTGYRRDEIENRMDIRTFIHESSRGQAVDYHRRRRMGDQSVPSHYEIKIVTRSERIIDAAVSVGIFPGTNQSIFAFSDITEQKRSRIELERHAERVKAMLAIYQMVDSLPEQVAEATLDTIMT